MLTQQLIVTALERHAVQSLPPGVPVVLPGVVLDAESTPEWIEFTCDQLDGTPQRLSSVELRDVSITLQVFARSAQGAARVHQLVEAARTAFSTRTIEIVGTEAPATIGGIRFREADVRDMTRVHAAHQRRALRHFAVSVTGRVQSYQSES